MIQDEEDKLNNATFFQAQASNATALNTILGFLSYHIVT